MQKKVVQIEKENIGSENIILWEAKTEGDLKQGSWVDKIAYDGEGAELIRVKTMDDELDKVAFGLKLGICSDSMDFEWNSNVWTS